MATEIKHGKGPPGRKQQGNELQKKMKTVMRNDDDKRETENTLWRDTWCSHCGE
jgi:hypothetical protein